MPSRPNFRAVAAVLAAMAVLLPLSATPVLAICGSCPACAKPYLVRASHAETRAVITGSIEAAASRIVATIQDSTRILSETEQRSLEALERIADAQEAQAMRRERERIRARAEGGRYDPTWVVCETVTATVGAPPPMQRTVAEEESEPQTAGGRIRRESTRARLCLDENGQPDPTMPACQGGGAVASEIVAAQEELAGMGGWTDPTAEVEMVIGRPTASIPGVEQERVDDAVARLGTNILDPFPEAPLTLADDTPEGRREQARRIAEEARLSAPRALWSWIVDLQQPVHSSERLREMSWIDPEAEIPELVSERHLHDLLVRSRFRNPEWHLEMAQASPEAVTRETLATLALLVDIQWLQFELDLHRAAAEVAGTADALERP